MDNVTLSKKVLDFIQNHPRAKRREVLASVRFAVPLKGGYEKRCNVLDNLFRLGLVDAKFARPELR